jgi:hypothetical protein
MASPLGKSLKVLCASISLIPGYENEIGFPEKTGDLENITFYNCIYYCSTVN